MQYIFYSEDGYCESPTGEKVENFQVLGITNGKDEQQAYTNLLEENKWIRENKFRESHIFYKMIIPYEIKRSLETIINYLYEEENKFTKRFDIKDNVVDIINHLNKIKKYLL